MTGQQSAHCGHCNDLVALYYSDLWRCTRCNSPTLPAQAQPAAAASRSGAVGGHVVAMVGGAIVAISPFLPWVTMGILSASGLQKTGNEALVLVGFGLLAALLALLELVRAAETSGLLHLILGGICLALLMYYKSSFQTHLDELEGGLFQVELGSGIYIGMFGAALMVAGGIAALAGGKR